MEDSTRARPEAKEEVAPLEERIASTEERIARQERMFTALITSLVEGDEDEPTVTERVSKLEKLVNGLIDALGGLYANPTINAVLDVQDRDVPLKLRVPPVVQKAVDDCVQQGLEVAEAVHSLAWEHHRIGATLSVLSDDETLPIATTTHDPQAERLDVLRRETGEERIYTILDFIADLGGGTSPASRSPMDLRAELGLSERQPSP